MKISLDRAYRPLEIEIGEEGEEGHVSVVGRIDLTDTALDRTARLVTAAQSDIAALRAQAEALAPDDERGARLLAVKMAGMLKSPICAAITEETYDEVLLALGGGNTPLPAYDANLLMTQVFAEIARVVMDHASKLKDNKAAHYLMDMSAGAES